MRRGLRRILELTGSVDVVGEAADGVDAVELASRLQPDVILMDVGLPHLNGIEATRRIQTTAPGTQVLMLSIHSDEQYIHQSLAAGARGYLLKDGEAEELVAAVLAVQRYETSLSRARIGTDIR